MAEDRLRIAAKVIVTNAEGIETGGGEVFMGHMKLEDIYNAEKYLLTEMPQLFVKLLEVEKSKKKVVKKAKKKVAKKIVKKAGKE